MTITRPALRYFGGKWKLADWVLSHLPIHKAYLEPFGGACSVLLKKTMAPIEVYNDINGDIVNYFRVLREQTPQLLAQLELTPYSRQEFLNCADLSAGDALERARRFYVRSWQGRSFGGLSDHQNTWRVFCNPHDVSHTLASTWVVAENLYAVANRLRNVQIECTDAIELIKKYDKQDLLIYVDPPYEISTRSGFRYKHETSDTLQEMLAATLTTCESMLVLSGYRCPAYDEWYKGWQRIDRIAHTQASNLKTARSTAVESLWLNPAVQTRMSSLFR